MTVVGTVGRRILSVPDNTPVQVVNLATKRQFVKLTPRPLQAVEWEPLSNPCLAQFPAERVKALQFTCMGVDLRKVKVTDPGRPLSPWK
ncbi:hypothetical protein BaRGS_00039307 [Batillaria attramentaria]|uniref:Uncharacterized protein n=1 Tax=Batillaria attramentaria TaxID=370345 RepID=A0ABD0J3A8_9CAEN